MNYEITADDYFAIIPEKVLYADISHIAVRIYGVLRRHADQTGSCHPGRARIANLAHTSPSSVDRAIQQLVEHGFITVHHRRNPDNPQQLLSNRYVIHSTPPASDHTPLPLVGTPPPASDEETKAIEPEPNNQFDEWWQIYPKKINKQQAHKAWKRHTKNIDPNDIIEATRKQLNTPETPLSADHQYIPYPASWLNAGSYENDITSTSQEPTRPYDQPTHHCNRCDSTGHITNTDSKGYSYAHPCPECSDTI
jgi:hypothetical protein